MFISFLYDIVYFLPARKNLSFNWNFGLILGLILVLQLFSGLFLLFYFSPDSLLAFGSVQFVMFESNFGWLFRLLHFNGASFFFFFIFAFF